MQDATSILHATLAADPGDAEAHLLLCRVYYAQEQADPAVRECALAASSAQASEQQSDAQMWLGRSYGLKARHAGPIAGFQLARKVQAAFSRAVELNPDNAAAVNDLGEYDVSAPAIVGGGVDKAEELERQILGRLPGSAHLLLARIAVERKDWKTAEAEFREEIAADRTPEAWMNLADFLQSRDRNDDAAAAVRAGVALDRAHGPALVDAASILTAAKRDAALAERCLRDYLASRARSDAAPAFKAHLQLAGLLQARGDAAGAQREVQEATALAPDYVRANLPEQLRGR